ncbi:MAG: PDZ domain-containing protein [Planctomycetota bacterium]|nr:PDZ domain-containing protein [Planctomycetota bacterium]
MTWKANVNAAGLATGRSRLRRASVCSTHPARARTVALGLLMASTCQAAFAQVFVANQPAEQRLVGREAQEGRGLLRPAQVFRPDPEDFERPRARATTAGPTLSPSELSEAIAKLDSPRLDDREAASALLSGVRLSVAEAISLAIAPDRSPEQRERLWQVARKRFDAVDEDDRAALGVSFATALDETAPVRIGGALAEFDCARTLRPNDEIRTIDGEPVFTNLEFRCQILSRDPGDVVRLGVQRQGVVAEFDVTLGSFGQLNSRGALSQEFLEDAWRLRVARAERSGGVAKQVLMPAPRGEEFETIDALAGPLVTPISLTESARPLVAGGVSRGGLRHDDSRRVGSSQQLLPPMIPGVIDGRAGAQFRLHEREAIAMQMERLRQQIQAIGEMAELYRQRLTEPALLPDDRVRIAQDLAMQEMVIAKLKEDLKRLEARSKR